MRVYLLAGAVVLTSFFLIGFYWTYLGRAQLVAAQRQGCLYDINDRRADITVRAAQAWANQQVADDPRQPLRTRRARGIEAAATRSAVSDALAHVDDTAVAQVLSAVTGPVRRVVLALDTGRRLDCTEQYPDASLLPHRRSVSAGL